MDRKAVNKRVVEALIKAGAFDSINPERSKLLASVARGYTHAETTEGRPRGLPSSVTRKEVWRAGERYGATGWMMRPFTVGPGAWQYQLIAPPGVPESVGS